MAITLEDLTKGTIDGNGTFDELMRTVKAHLQEEYDQDRITGADYANVYLGSVQATLAQAVQFELQKGINTQQEAVLSGQSKMVERQADMVIDQHNLVKEQVIGQTQTNANLVKTEAKLDEEILLLKAQITDLAKAGIIKDKQSDKLGTEKDLLAQRILTEEANTRDTLSNGSAVAGTVGAQTALLNQQKDGFKRDAEQKATKQLLDIWSVQRTTDEGLAPPSSVNNTEIDKVVAVLKAGIGV